MKKIISGFVLIIVATSLSSAQRNRGVPLDNEVSRIVNGELAADVQFPYQVRLLINGEFNCTYGQYICGGSIIAKNWVLTAGHCTMGPGRINLRFLGWIIEAGEIFVDQPRQRRIVQLPDAYPHPDYDPRTLENDLGLLHTVVPFDFTTPYVKPIHLVAPNVNKASYVGDVVTVSGFGLTANGTLPNQLYYTNLTIIDFNQCNEVYVARGENPIPTTCFCAENIINNSSTCGGDSGGPVTLMKKGKLIQIGLVSFGSGVVGCNESPNGFTDLSVFIPWIQEMIHGKYKN